MLGFLPGLIGLVSTLVKLFMAWKLMDLGRGQAVLEALENANKEIAEARKIRLDERRANESNPDNILRPDKFTRKDE